ncbi:MAG: hypothetical protein B6242_13730 [Anaerolineaceae bacterium 4572_78]|nr:MAG: hypothetical protein B6242_13730 [Anaerolineaceae bacterium 4572_78]
METTLKLNNSLIEPILKLGNHATIMDAIQKALEFYLQYLQQQAILAEFGQVDYFDDYDYETQRAMP